MHGLAFWPGTAAFTVGQAVLDLWPPTVSTKDHFSLWAVAPSGLRAGRAPLEPCTMDQ